MHVSYIYMITEFKWWSFWGLSLCVVIVYSDFLESYTVSIFMMTESSTQESDSNNCVSEYEFEPSSMKQVSL